MILRDYQSATLRGVGDELRKGHRSVIAQGATGSGKTPIMGSIINSLTERGIPSILIVPRQLLIDQGSSHLSKWGVTHSIIHGKRTYSPAFYSHVASLQTTMKNWIKILEQFRGKKVYFIIDEAHINYDWQIRFKAACLAAEIDAYFIGFTATPEKLDGRGLHTSAGGIWDSIVYSLSIPELTRLGWLSPLEYYALKIDGIDDIKMSGMKWNNKSTEDFFNTKGEKVYGDVIGHYEKFAVVKPQTISTTAGLTRSGQFGNKTAVFFCPSVKRSEELTQKMRLKGYRFHTLYGTMPKGERAAIIEALKKGEIDGVTSCDLITYGFDCPPIEYMGIVRKTASRPLGFQMWGRGTRLFTLYRCCGKLYDNRPSCPSCGGSGVVVYKKESCHVSDHVGLYKKLEDPEFPDIPGPWLDNIDWNFMGDRKKKKDVTAKRTGRICPERQGYLCMLPSCNGCEYYNGDSGGSYKSPIEIDIELKKIENLRGFATVPAEERQEVRDRIAVSVSAWRDGPQDKTLDSDKHVKALLDTAELLGYKPLWVYNQLSEGMLIVNVPALSAIQRVKGYKPGWVRFQVKIIEKKLRR